MTIPSVDQIEKDLRSDARPYGLPVTAWWLPKWVPKYKMFTASDDAQSRRYIAELIHEELNTCNELRKHLKDDSAVYVCVGAVDA